MLKIVTFILRCVVHCHMFWGWQGVLLGTWRLKRVKHTACVWMFAPWKMCSNFRPNQIIQHKDTIFLPTKYASREFILKVLSVWRFMQCYQVPKSKKSFCNLSTQRANVIQILYGLVCTVTSCKQATNITACIKIAVTSASIPPTKRCRQACMYQLPLHCNVLATVTWYDGENRRC